MSAYSIKSLPAEERPRERLMRHGPESMSTAEILAAILGSGTKGKNVLDLAQEIVVRFGTLERLSEATVPELQQIHGLGQVKAIQLKAALSLGVRLKRETVGAKYHIDHPVHAYHLVKDQLENEKREVFLVILLDSKGCVIRDEVISIGTLSSSLVHPREVFYPAIRHKAASIILVHNHPSGDPTPSPQDFEVTETLVEVGGVVGIPVHDHIVVGKGSYCSLRQKGARFS